jgi:DNA-binding GntR family transcriptional regulator
MSEWIQYPTNVSGSRPKTAGNWLVDRLRQAIISGELLSNQPIRQEEIASTYQVSRMPVRQALDILTVEGWVEQRPHRGATVTPLDPDDALELFEVREALEILAARRSFPNLSEPQRDTIRAAWKALVDEQGDPFILHQSFHLALYAAAGPRIQRLIMQQLDAVQRYLRFEQSHVNNAQEDWAEHEALLAAALDGDAERGVATLRAHLADGGKVLAESLRQRILVGKSQGG